MFKIFQTLGVLGHRSLKPMPQVREAVSEEDLFFQNKAIIVLQKINEAFELANLPELANTAELAELAEKKDISSKRQLLAKIVARSSLPDQLREDIPETSTLALCLNQIKEDLDKKLLLIALGLNKLSWEHMRWRSTYLTADSLISLLNSLEKESDKKLVTDICLYDNTIANFCFTHPQLLPLVAPFIDVESPSFRYGTAIAQIMESRSTCIGGSFFGNKTAARSGPRVWDDLIVYSYNLPALERLEPFLLAAKNQDIAGLRTILAQDRACAATESSLLSITGGYSNPLILCAENNLVEGVRAIIEESPCRVEANAIKFALRYAKTPEVARLMLGAGVDLKDRDREYAWGVFSYACQKSREMLEFYFDLGVGVEHCVSPENRQTLLMVAAESGKIDTMNLLLDRGADIEATRANGCTALYHAIERPEAVQILLERVANPNHGLSSGLTPLVKAVEYGDYQSTRLLVRYGAQITPEVLEKAQKNRGYGKEFNREFTRTSEFIIKEAMTPAVAYDSELVYSF